LFDPRLSAAVWDIFPRACTRASWFRRSAGRPGPPPLSSLYSQRLQAILITLFRTSQDAISILFLLHGDRRFIFLSYNISSRCEQATLRHFDTTISWRGALPGGGHDRPRITLKTCKVQASPWRDFHGYFSWEHAQGLNLHMISCLHISD